MSRKVRKQIYIEPRQEEMLKRQARELGVTQAELIRRCIDQIDRASVNLPPDQKAWEEARAVIQERMRIAAPQNDRTWTCEELYGERLRRISH